MQIDHILAARRFVQVVYILRDDAGDITAAFKFCDCTMSGVGFRVRNSVPSCKTLRQVAPPLAFVIDEFGKLHRRLVFPVAIVVPILGDAGVGAATGAGQDNQARMLANKADETFCLANLA